MKRLVDELLAVHGAGGHTSPGGDRGGRARRPAVLGDKGRRLSDNAAACTGDHGGWPPVITDDMLDTAGELAQLGPTGYRPLRIRDTLF